MSGDAVDELMVAALAERFSDDTVAFNGAASFIPVTAFQLARATHAPNLVWAASSIAVDARPDRLGPSTLDAGIWGGAAMLENSPFDFWSYAQGARFNTFCFRGAQIDRFGNVNNTVIGTYDRPKVRLPGGGGMADLGCMIPRIFLWSTTHSPRVLVERVNFVSGIGYGRDGEERARLGLPGGPQFVVTNLCTMDFHPETRRMRLRSLHSGARLDEVVAATGFELVIEDDPVPVTREATEEEVRLIREIDPTGMRKREFAA